MTKTVRKTATILVFSTVSLVSICTSGLKAEQRDSDASSLSLIERSLNEGRPAATFRAAVANDYLISESVAPSRFDQRNVNVARFPDGRRLVVWDDNRMGPTKIFWRLLDTAGMPVAEDQMLIGSTVGSNLSNPVVGIDSSSMVHLFFRNSTTGLILGAVFDSNLTRIVPPFQLNDSTLNAFAGSFDAAVYPNGKAVATWENYSGLSINIEYCIIDSVGHFIFAPTAADSGGGTFSRFDPSVAVDPAGDFLIAWDDRRNGQADIFVRLLNGAGIAYGAEENLLSSPDAQYEPDVTFSPSGEFLISWVDSRGSGQIFGKRYDNNQGQIGSPVLISDSVNLADNSGVSAAAMNDGSYRVAWASSTPQSHIVAARLDSNLLGSGNISIDSMIIGQKFNPFVLSEDTTYIAAWEQVLSANSDVVYRLFDSSGSALMTSERVLNTDSIGAPSTAPAIAAVQQTEGAKALVAFTDERSGSADIWLQAISEDGVKAAGNVQVSQDITDSHQDQPAIDVASGRALIVWLDSRVVNLITGLRVYGRYVDLDGNFIGNEFMISDTAQASLFGEPKVVLNGSGKALSAWVDSRVSSDSLRVYGRMIDNSGNLVGSEFELSSASDTSCSDLSLGSDSAGNFYAGWLDRGKDTASVTIRRFDSTGVAQGMITWRPANDSVSVEEVAIAVSSGSEIAVLWVGVKTDRQLYLTVFDTTGAVVHATVPVNSNLAALPSDPRLSFSENGYLTTGWIDRSSGRRVMTYQIYDDQFNTVDANSAVTSTTVETMEQPALTAAGGRAWFTWVDPRANGRNVYMSNHVFLPTAVADKGHNSLPQEISLFQNYPNPFNPSTEIRFSLPKRSEISLDIYNLLGRKVRNLLSGDYAPGEHLVLWDSRNDNGQLVASGVYFYRLRSGETVRSKKMLLLK